MDIFKKYVKQVTGTLWKTSINFNMTNLRGSNRQGKGY